MKIRITASASRDLEEGFWFYEKQQEGLGDYFIDILFSDIDSLALYAGIHNKVNQYYRMLSAKFPFAIYYTHQDNTVSIYAVLDCRRSPAWIREKLE